MKEIKCLNCNENAHELFLQSQYHIYLNDVNKFITFLPRKNQKKITKNSHNKSPYIKVYYCEKCKLVWFHIDD